MKTRCKPQRNRFIAYFSSRDVYGCPSLSQVILLLHLLDCGLDTKMGKKKYGLIRPSNPTAGHTTMGFSRQEYWSGVPSHSPVASANRVLICCTCYFQSSSLFFVYFGFPCLQISSVSTSSLTQGGEGGHLFRLTCSVVLRGGRNTANKYHWCVWGVLAVSGPHGVCLCSWRVYFPGLHCSGSRLFCWRTI